jgi:hypothetical protein
MIANDDVPMQISRVSAEAFADMPSLAELDLSRNKLIADAVDGPIFNLVPISRICFSAVKLACRCLYLCTAYVPT